MRTQLIGLCGLIVLICLFVFPETTEAGSGIGSPFEDAFRMASGFGGAKPGGSSDSHSTGRHRGRGRRGWRRRGRLHGYRRRHQDDEDADSDETAEDAPAPTWRDPCYYRRSRGSCPDRQERWYFNNHFGECRPFTFSGCGGNPNNFISRRNCEDYCGGGYREAPEERPEEKEDTKEEKSSGSSTTQTKVTTTETETSD